MCLGLFRLLCCVLLLQCTLFICASLPFLSCLKCSITCHAIQSDLQSNLIECVCTLYVDVVCLTYVYMLEFVLDDGSGWLSAGLWKEEAVSSFTELQKH